MSGETHTVKRAILMAAGIGKRLRPVTLDTPKPLIRVNGVRMIDTVIRALHANGIREIYVVVGYKKERFSSLPEEYPGLVLIENPRYDTCNNISSLYAAREHLEDCIILDGDQIVYDPTVLDPHFTRSGYNAVWREDETDEWMLTVQDGVVTACSRTGGSHGWQLYSVSRWSAADGARLKKHLEEQFEGGNTDIYWDDVALFCYPEQYALGVRPMQAGDVIEIDGLDELIALDPSYKNLIQNGEANNE